MGRKNLGGELVVAMNGFAVGRWTSDSRGNHQFRYDPDWLQVSGAIPISLSMPLSPEPFSGDRVWNFFDNLLPDNADIRRRLQARLGATSTKPFDLLAGIGGDCVGALQIYPPSVAPPDVRRVDCDELDDEQIAETLRNYRDRPLGIERDGDFRISIAGAQEKTALLWHRERWCRPRGATPTSHILKLPIGFGGGGIDLTDSVENEWLCLQLAAELGLPVANAAMHTFADQKALVVERFDRRWASDGSWLTRLHQEDFCQALCVSPGSKYEADGGPGALASFDLLLRSQNPEGDRRTFFRALVVYWLLAAIDGHAKNFSLFLLPGGRCTMTPLYDVLSAYPIVARRQLEPRKVKMSMAAVSKNRHYRWHDIEPRHLRSTAEHAGVPRADIDKVLHDLTAHGEQAIETVRERLPSDFPRAVSDAILDGVGKALARIEAA